MKADAETPHGSRVLSKGRMEGFSDGVFGFAITLLVADIALHPPGTPLQQALGAWPAYLAYLTSFLTIGGAWLLHTALTDQLAQIDQLFLRLNLFVLLVVVLLPFPTRLMADALKNTSGERVFVTMYGLTLLAIRLLGSALDAYARYEHLYSPAAEGVELQTTQRKFLPVVAGYVIAIITGLLLPVVAAALYAGLAVYLVVPFREAARVLIRRHGSGSGGDGGSPLPRAKSAGEDYLPGAGSCLGEDGFEVIARRVFGHHHALGDLAGVEALAEQPEDFGLAVRQSAGPGVHVQAVCRGARLDRHGDVRAQPGRFDRHPAAAAEMYPRPRRADRQAVLLRDKGGADVVRRGRDRRHRLVGRVQPQQRIGCRFGLAPYLQTWVEDHDGGPDRMQLPSGVDECAGNRRAQPGRHGAGERGEQAQLVRLERSAVVAPQIE